MMKDTDIPDCFALLRVPRDVKMPALSAAIRAAQIQVRGLEGQDKRDLQYAIDVMRDAAKRAAHKAFLEERERIDPESFARTVWETEHYISDEDLRGQGLYVQNLCNRWAAAALEVLKNNPEFLGAKRIRQDVEKVVILRGVEAGPLQELAKLAFSDLTGLRDVLHTKCDGFESLHAVLQSRNPPRVSEQLRERIHTWSREIGENPNRRDDYYLHNILPLVKQLTLKR
jgi:hypothetical protein